MAKDPVVAWLSAEAGDRGYTTNQLRGPHVTRLAHGLYIAAGSAVDLPGRCEALGRVLPRRYAFSHHTAAALLGLPTIARTSEVHVLFPAGTSRPQRNGIVAHSGTVQFGDVITRGALLITSPARVYVDLAGELPASELVALGDAVARLVGIDTLRRRVAQNAGRRGAVLARDCLRLLDPRAQSRPESLVRYFVQTSVLPSLTPQVPIVQRVADAIESRAASVGKSGS